MATVPRRVWILGAADPEMAMIEDILRGCGQVVAYATLDGVRVSARTAYAANGTVPEVKCLEAVLVECGGDELMKALQPARLSSVDHHRPGDWYFNTPPADFLHASSLGQVLSILAGRGDLVVNWPGWGWRREEGESEYFARIHNESGPTNMLVRLKDQCGVEELWAAFSALGVPASRKFLIHYGLIWRGKDGAWWVGTYTPSTSGFWFRLPDEVVFCAAADQCLGAAYRGDCPGVDPQRLMHWRVQSRARQQGRPVEALLSDIEAARRALLEAPTVELAPGIAVRDLRGGFVPELPEAAAREGLAFLATPGDAPGDEKVVLQVASPEEVRAFIETWAPAHGLCEIYGDPARGFAGGYHSQVPSQPVGRGETNNRAG